MYRHSLTQNFACPLTNTSTTFFSTHSVTIVIDTLIVFNLIIIAIITLFTNHGCIKSIHISVSCGFGILLLSLPLRLCKLLLSLFRLLFLRLFWCYWCQYISIIIVAIIVVSIQIIGASWFNSSLILSAWPIVFTNNHLTNANK